MAIIKTLWIGNGAVLKSSSQWQLTHYQTTNFRLFQLKEFADNNFKFDESGRKLSRWEENTVGKGEIARYKQFLAPLAVGQRAYVMARCPSSVRPSVRPCINFFFKHLLR